ncbi:hypothetical protein BX54_00445 [Escherichia coli O121:H19 str. 2010C-3840]|nr:hypothetical protein BX62_03300 [Escherichia coli O121:H19 str. 2010C-4254]EYV03088.1 hypothetical protein BX54_00445 [Escherichia coli O121:H19 str. 2010C-3840]EYV03627.1 hypothetical protein BX52_03110 [Escherichia coli O121:H19 str. 2010C-3609]EYV11885.1 hypothetical protein BX51_18475 [Escherichia coli O145:NM str. 2010C-3526]EYV21761.1 hypothetical protein BX48_10630 [Escherichia coli O145:NM str. 2010C-3517]EYV22697.1 hypothetical protein BX49_24405 [Escherichia coli O145:NM str. 2010
MPCVRVTGGHSAFHPLSKPSGSHFSFQHSRHTCADTLYTLHPLHCIEFRLRRNIATIQRYHCQGISIGTFVRQFCVVRFREQFAQRLRDIIPVFQRFTQCFGKLCITVFCRALNFFTKVFNFFAPDFTSAHGSFPVSRDCCFRFRCDCLRLQDVTIFSGLPTYFCLLCELRQ